MTARVDSDDDGRGVVLALQRAMASATSKEEIVEASAKVEALFAAEQDWLLRVCLKFVSQPDRARDAAQDVMLVAYTRLPEYRGDSSFRTWLYGIARFVCYNIRRKRREVLDDESFLEIRDEGPGSFSLLRRDERMALLSAAAEAVLDPIERKAVHLRYVEMLTAEQITQMLDLDSASGARGLLQRCRRKLDREIRRRLQELGHGSSFIRPTV